MGQPASALAAPFDTVSVCLSKGLGAPVGSVLVGTAEFIAGARRWRKVVGGGMRQVGMLAAAGIHVLENHVDRLADDHVNARTMAEGLRALNGCQIDMTLVQTNMVYLGLPDDRASEIPEKLRERGILVCPGNPMRLVTHLDVSAEDVQRTLRAFEEIL
tara:strand:+ start:77 stop:553 length:477 start_codon:yes stop_codon:yes gene_type:complete